MVTSAPARLELEVLLHLVGIKLELTPTQYADAVSKYQAVADWLSAPGTSLAAWLPDLYPQGSLRLLTTVKPRSHEEYDLDIVCQFVVDSWLVSPGELYTRLHNRLAENATYRAMLEGKNRCVRLNYAGSFHMDILGACPDQARGGTCILVPDRAARDWSPSNPKGFAQWFESTQQTRVLAKAIEPLPLPLPVPNKTPLQRTVQLVKRQRDEAFSDPTIAPASVVLTTLAGDAYVGDSMVASAVSSYLERTSQLVEAAWPQPIQVFNPSNKAELLSERWEDNPEAYDAFRAGLQAFRQSWAQLMRASTLAEMSTILNQLFGEEVTTCAVGEYSNMMAKARSQGSVGTRVGTPGLVFGAGPAVKRIPPNTNYGAPQG